MIADSTGDQERCFRTICEGHNDHACVTEGETEAADSLTQSGAGLTTGSIETPTPEAKIQATGQHDQATRFSHASLLHGQMDRHKH